MKNTLCLYYSRTGHTKDLIQQIANKLDAEVVAYTDGKDRSGTLGYIGCCFASMSRRYPKILPFRTERPINEYEHVVVAMPVWVEGPCVIGKALLQQCAGDFPENVHLVVTHMAENSYEKQILKLNDLLKTPYKSLLTVSTKKEDLSAEVDAFVASI